MNGNPSPDGLASTADLLGRLGGDMVAAGAPVDGVRRQLHEAAAGLGSPDASIVVLPTVLVIELAAHPPHRVPIEVTEPTSASLRFDQVDALYRLQSACAHGQLAPTDALAELDRVENAPPTFPAIARIVGHGLLTAGFSLLLQPSLLQLGICFALGLAIGAVKLWSWRTLETVFPILTTFAVALLVFWLAGEVEALSNPLRILIPPLVTFLPAGAMTTATAELAAGEMIAGASRLVYGIVRLMTLAFAILVAATIESVPPQDLIDSPIDRLGSWSPWAGIALFTAGIVLHFCAPRTSIIWITLVLVVAYLGQSLGENLFDPQFGGFFGALAMTPLVLWLSDRTYGPPALLTFLPGFWFLVPGAAGLIGVTEILGATSPSGGAAFASAIVGILSIALGALVGSSAYRTATTRTMQTRAD